MRIDCVLCYDRGVIHFTDLAPSKNHEPVPGDRPQPLRGRVMARDGSEPTNAARAVDAEGRGRE